MSQPNVVYFIGDDVGWNNVDWHNNENNTPYMNNLLKDGIELDRFYTFLYCSPSRSSLMTGRYPFHVQQNNYPNWDLGQGVPEDIEFIAKKFKDKNYTTIHAGKWHLGMQTWKKIPISKGFDYSLGYFEGAVDHLSQRSCADAECMVPVNITSPVLNRPFDLWLNDSPAQFILKSYRKNTTSEIVLEFAKNILKNQDSKPFFLYYASPYAHTPLEVGKWKELSDYQIYEKYIQMMDNEVKELVDIIKNKGLWDNTLFIFSSDNGGAIYFSEIEQFKHHAGGNNWPLKGGKVSNWEGGVRTVAFISGGYLPKFHRGTKNTDLIHISDFYNTFCDLLNHTNCNSSDSMSLLPFLKYNRNISRNFIPLSIDYVPNDIISPYIARTEAIILGKYKLLYGKQYQTFYTGPYYPNASSLEEEIGKLSNIKLWKDCRFGCLYNIFKDPTEQYDIAKENINIRNQMISILLNLRKEKVQPISDQSERYLCDAQIKKNKNVYGPWIFD